MQVGIKSLTGRLILFSTILASGMAFLDGSVVNIAIPTIQAKLGANISDIQWVINSYTLVLSSLILISGSLGDHFGKKKIFALGILVFTLFSFLCSASQTITQLILFRALQGIGAAMMIPGSLSIINTSFEERVRGRAIGTWSGFAGGVAVLGPFLGGFLVQNLGWPSIFYINIPLGILAFILTVKFVPESTALAKRKLDTLGSLLIFLSLLGLSFGLINQPLYGWGDVRVVWSLIAGIVSFIAFVVSQVKQKEPLVPPQIFRSSLVVGANLATLCLYAALSGVIFFLILNFQQAQHYSPIFSGMAMLPSILLITFLSGPGGVVADKLGPRIPMVVGSLVVALGMGSMILPGLGANYFTQFLPGLILFGLGMSAVIAPLTKSALSVKAEHSGSASGVNNAVSRVGGLLAVALLGAVLTSVFSTDLEQRLSKSNLNDSVRKQILDQRTKLLGVVIPSSLSPEQTVQVRQDLEESFIAGFKTIMGINASLALLSALISALTIRKSRDSFVN